MNFTKLFLFVFLCAFKTSSYATIPPLAFKEITGHLKPDKVYYSPTLGQIALDVLSPDLRFYGPFDQGEEKRNPSVRSYRHDHSKDPLWQLVKFLFPSAHRAFTAVAQDLSSKALKQKEILFIPSIRLNL